ncbi:MAG: glutathione S-transferase family protein [Actinobacteria bacterium]|nr:glutathione S-transferase family protein [Actinomycetota bacterium]
MAQPIELYYWPTPNGWKVTIFLEEARLPYNVIPIDITAGDQFEPEFLVTLQWLMFQMGSVGPMFGQAHHFRRYAPEEIPYAIDRYTNEATRLYRVMDKRLSEAEYFAGEYSIADMAIYPWTISHEAQGQKMEDFPNLKRWYEDVRARPAVRKALEVGEELRRPLEGMDQKTRETLFGSRQYGER